LTRSCIISTWAESNEIWSAVFLSFVFAGRSMAAPWSSRRVAFSSFPP